MMYKVTLRTVEYVEAEDEAAATLQAARLHPGAEVAKVEDHQTYADLALKLYENGDLKEWGRAVVYEDPDGDETVPVRYVAEWRNFHDPHDGRKLHVAVVGDNAIAFTSLSRPGDQDTYVYAHGRAHLGLRHILQTSYVGDYDAILETIYYLADHAHPETEFASKGAIPIRICVEAARDHGRYGPASRPMETRGKGSGE